MQKAIVLNELNTGAWSNDVSPGVGCEPCRVGQAPPSFVTAGYFSRDGYENPKWNGKSVCYDYQNWLASSNPAIRYVSVDVYENTDTCGTLIPLKMCVYDPNNLCTNDLL